MRILIVGYGYVGAALSKLLVRDGHTVWGMKRDPEIGLDIETIFADVTKPDTMLQLPAALDAVIYAVGAGAYDAARYQAVYEQGQRNLIDIFSCRARGCTRNNPANGLMKPQPRIRPISPGPHCWPGSASREPARFRQPLCALAAYMDQAVRGLSAPCATALQRFRRNRRILI